MNNSAFNNRVFGCAIIKAINSNFNADFTSQPRTLPDGRVYATDKALKYSIRHYLQQKHPDEKVLYYKRLNENTHPLSLAELYDSLGLGKFDDDHKDKKKVLKQLLTCVDVRLFGSTFAPKKGSSKVNLSVHGPVQINHGMNQFYKDGNQINEIYSEQISAPFRSDGATGEEAEQATLGRQSKLREGHYVYHFSINPQNLAPLVELAGDGATGLTADDIDKLKEALRLGVTHFDSSSKAGSDNELLFWVQLKSGSKRVLPSFTEMVHVTHTSGKVQIDLSKVSAVLKHIEEDQIEKIELFYLPESADIIGAPDSAAKYNLLTGHNLLSK